MITLAIDTAAEVGSIALADAGGVLEQVRLDAPGGFGQMLFGALEALLARQGVRLADIGLYAAATGPGSFTGVRIGLAAIKGLAEVAGKPAVGISNLEALASRGTAELRAPVIDARRGEVFAAVYDRAGVEIVPASVLSFSRFLELVGARPVEYVSAGLESDVPLTIVPPELAATIAHLAMARFAAGGECDPASIEANYVRRSDAELFWKAV